MHSPASERGRRVLDEQYRKNRSSLVRRGNEVLDHRQDAEDAVQNVFLAILASSVRQRRLANVRDPLAYLATAVQHECYKLVRKRERQLRVDRVGAQRSPLHEESCPSRRLERKDLSSLLDKLEGQLTNSQRQLLQVLRQNPELTTRELGARLGYSHKNVQNKLARIRKVAAKVLAADARPDLPADVAKGQESQARRPPQK